MKKLFVTLALCVVAAGLSAAPKQQQKWVDLFNGKNLKGWKVLNGTADYAVENGTIVGISKTGTPNSFLCTEKTFGDFILEMEFLPDDKLNSGVQFRSESREDYRNGRVHGYQYEIDPSPRAYTGGIYDEARRKWLYTLAQNEAARKAFKPGEWNKLRIEAIGNSIRTFLNGVPCADILDSTTPEGFIALQVHAVKGEEMAGRRQAWRNIRICTTDLEKERTPFMNGIIQYNYVPNTISEREAAEGWKLLFDGTSLNGWVGTKTGKVPAQGYDIENGELIVNKTEGKRGGDIMTEKRYGNFALIFEFALTPNANNGIKYLFQANMGDKSQSYMGPEFQIIDNNYPDLNKGVVIPRSRDMASLYEILPPVPNTKGIMGDLGQWVRGMVVVDGNMIEHWLNNEKVLDIDRFSYVFGVLRDLTKFKEVKNFGQFEDGHIVITDHKDQVRFRSLKIREL